MEKKAGKHVWKQQPHARVTAQTHKMSKSRGNVVNPDDVVHQYGADSLRLYEMFLGPLQDTKVCFVPLTVAPLVPQLMQHSYSTYAQKKHGRTACNMQ